MYPRHLMVLALLVLAVGINYIDRGSLSVAKPELAREFGLDNARMGLLFSAFFWSYALFQLVSGWLVDRLDVKWVYAAGFLVWSLAAAAMGMVSGFATFLALRLMLGIGESVAYPATSRLLAASFPEERRGVANALVDAASKIGPALSTLIGGLVVAHHGWRILFLSVGFGSLLWLIPWVALVPSQGGSLRRCPGTVRERQVTLADLLGRRELWGTSLGMFCLGYAWYFLVSWLPSYLVEERKFSMGVMAILGSLPFWAMAAASVMAGWLSDSLIRRGGSATRVRKTFLLAGFGLCAALVWPAVVTRSPGMSVGLLTAACAALGLFTSNVWAVTQTLAGEHAAGKWTGVQNAVGNLGGVVSPALTGWIVAVTGSFQLAFAATSVALIIGMGAYVLFVGRICPLTWPERSPTASTAG